jgi:hypothetical protein
MGVANHAQPLRLLWLGQTRCQHTARLQSRAVLFEAKSPAAARAEDRTERNLSVTVWAVGHWHAGREQLREVIEACLALSSS